MIPPLLTHVCSWLYLAVGLFAPGWLVCKALGTAQTWAGIFIGSAVILMETVLVLDLAGIPLTSSHVALGLVIICGVLGLIAKLRITRPVRDSLHRQSRPPILKQKWLILPAAIGLAAIVIKVLNDPLSGFDTGFRWDFLARQMFELQSLHFYPPTSADDFTHYGWCDGIPPLVSTQYFWAYASFGSVKADLTTPIVLIEAALLFRTVYSLSARRGGTPAGLASMAVLATSCVPLWSVSIGQETGLMAICGLGMYLFIERYQESPSEPWLIWAGIAAGAAGLVREYGMIFILLGMIALTVRRLPMRNWLQFLPAAILLPLPWYLRNWAKTGNPLYSYDLRGLFPTNPVNSEYFNVVKELTSINSPFLSAWDVLLLVVTLMPVPVILGSIGSITAPRKAGHLVIGILTIILLWFWSIGLTSGGPIYSLRVLAPALAFAAVLSGPIVANWAAGRRGWVIIICSVLIAVDAGKRSLFMPNDPWVAWWSIRSSAWLTFRDLGLHWNRDPNYAAIADAAQGRGILVDDPLLHGIFTNLGAKAVPMFSPEAAILFDDQSRFTACLSHLRNVNIRFILISRQNRISSSFTSRHPFFSDLARYDPVVKTGLFNVYDLSAGALAGL